VLRDWSWPPPEDWHRVTVLWQDMLRDRPNTRELLHWIENTYPGCARYQLRGSDASEHNSGFLFYFEDARDATVFRLTWCE